MNENFKEEVILACKEAIVNRIKNLEQAIKLVQESSNNNSKSTAGDKHDTERAMAQLEIEKLQKQLNFALSDYDFFKKHSSTISSNNRAAVGSLIYINNNWIYIMCGLGKITVNRLNVFVISVEAPVAKQLLGKGLSEPIEINGISGKMEMII